MLSSEQQDFEMEVPTTQSSQSRGLFGLISKSKRSTVRNMAMIRLDNELDEFQKKGIPNFDLCQTNISELEHCILTNPVSLDERFSLDKSLPSQQENLELENMNHNAFRTSCQEEVSSLMEVDENHGLSPPRKRNSEYPRSHQNSSSIKKLSFNWNEDLSRNSFFSSIYIKICPQKGPFENQVFIFQLFFPENYPHQPPRVYFQNITCSEQAKQLRNLQMLDPPSSLVKNVIFNEEWNPVLSLSQIILALELMITLPFEKTNQKQGSDLEMRFENSPMNKRSSLQIEADLKRKASKVKQIVPFKEFSKNLCFNQSPVSQLQLTSSGIQMKEKHSLDQRKRRWDQAFSSLDLQTEVQMKRLNTGMKGLKLNNAD